MKTPLPDRPTAAPLPPPVDATPRTPATSPAHAQHLALLKGFRPEIEGLRAVAVLLVVLFHAGVPFLPGGFVGVDVFFVISGFLITRLLLAEQLVAGRILMRRFYLRRARRLLPALALVIVATLVVSRITASPLVTENASVDGIWASVYLVNFHFLEVGLDYFAEDLPDSPLLHLWSLAVEEQFYLVWPALLGLVAARRARGTVRRCALAVSLLGAGSLVASLLLTPGSPVFAYYLPVTRFWELCAGAVIAMSLPRLQRVPGRLASIATWVGLGAIAIAAITFSTKTPFPGVAALLPVGGAVMVIAFAGSNQPLLTRRTMQRIGTISYSFYLWHWPLLVLLAGAGTATMKGMEVTLPIVALSAAFAWVTYHLVENPVRRSGWIAARARRGLALALVVTAVPVALAYVLLASSPKLTGAGANVNPTLRLGVAAGAEDRLQAEIRRSLERTQVPRNLVPALDNANMRKTKIFQFRCHLKTYGDRVVSPRCNYADRTSDTTIVLYGDSHAAHWFPALEQISIRNNWQLVSLTRGGCPPIDVAVSRASKQCEAWRENSIKRIAKEQPAMVVMSNLRGYCLEEACKAGTDRVLKDIRAAAPGATSTFIEDSPHHVEHAIVCLGENLNATHKCAPTSNDDAQVGIERSIRDNENALWVETTKWYCADGGCPVIIGNVLVAVDNDHMSIPMAKMLAPMLERKILPAIE